MSNVCSKRHADLIAVAWIASSFLQPLSAYATPAGEFDYPELMVTPRASERLVSEAAKEPSRRWASQLPVQASAIATLTAGIIQLGSPSPGKDPDGVSGWAGVAVGGAWLVTSIGLQAFHSPYASGATEVSAMPAKTPREQLARERAAEEVIRGQARLASRIRWLSLLTHLGANGYMISQAEGGSFAMVADGVAAALSLAPLVFGSHWSDVHHEQESYKKRIYAPIASATLMAEPSTGRAAPGLALTLSF